MCGAEIYIGEPVYDLSDMLGGVRRDIHTACLRNAVIHERQAVAEYLFDDLSFLADILGEYLQIRERGDSD